MYEKSKIDFLIKSHYTKETQHGFDLSLNLVNKYTIDDGMNPIKTDDDNWYNFSENEVYELICHEKLNDSYTHKDKTAWFRVRSSVARIGGWISVSSTDDTIKFHFFPTCNMKIKRNSRIVQVVYADNKEKIINKIPLHVKSVSISNGGVISDTTIVNPYTKILSDENGIVELESNNTYIFECYEGCNIKSNELAYITEDGVDLIVESPIFDAGFKTETISIMVFTQNDTKVTIGDYVCDLNFYKSENVDLLYNGQWQGK